MAIQTVLLIDDEPDIRKIGRLSLAGIGQWRVLLANGGEQGLEIAARERPDVILLDFEMPGMDGPAVLRQLKQTSETAAIPVIFLTGRAEQGALERYSALGAAGLIAKPFDPLSLPRMVAEIVDGT